MPRRVFILAPLLLFAALAAPLSTRAQAPEPSQAAATRQSPGARIFDIAAYGAIGDGETLNTAAIQKAIDDCSATSGGMVLVPGGNFVTGTIQLKSNVTLHLSAAGHLLGSKKRQDYTDGHGIPDNNGNIVLIYAVNAANLTIEGNGTIDGQGRSFFTGAGDGTGPRIAGQPRDPNAPAPYVDRPHLLIFERCDNLKIRDVFLANSAYHCMRILNSTRVNFDGIRIHNRVNRNNDGFHFNNCKYVRISNCEVICQDDACALFGSNQFVTVTNCTFSTRWSIFRFGGGDAQNVAVSNCLIYDTYGCPIKVGGGSHIENLSFSNIIMRNVTGPISVNFGGSGGRRGGGGGGARGANAAPRAPSYIRNLSFNNICATLVKQPMEHSDVLFGVNIKEGELNSCLTLNGYNNGVIENVSLNDVHVTSAGGGTAAQAAKRQIPQNGSEYFGVWTGPAATSTTAAVVSGPPAYGMYARNVKGLQMSNVSFDYAEADARPAVVFDNVQDATIANLSVEGSPNAESALRFVNTKNTLLDAPRLLSPSPLFLQVEGDGNKNITIDGGDFSYAAKPMAATRGAKASAVKIRQ